MASKATNTSTTPTAPTYVASALPTVAGTQYRHTSGGTGTAQATAYAQAMRALGAWARPAGHAPLVHALTHLGWCSGSGARSVCRAASSSAYKHGAPHLQAGEPAAPQVAATMQALAAAGAPAPLLATVWATYTGQPA